MFTTMLLNSDVLKIISISYKVLIGTAVAYTLAARQQTQVLLGLNSALSCSYQCCPLGGAVAHNVLSEPAVS